MVVDLPSLIYLLLAVALGSVVGLENEYRMQSGAKIYLGLRTCIFLSILGYIFALLYIITGSSILIAVSAAVITIIATSIYLAKSNIIRNPGATTFVATFVVFLSGVLVGLGYYEYAIVISVLTAAVSFYKREFLGFIHKIKRRELIAALNLLIISFLILPLLPNSFIGPYSFFNPFEFWFIVATVGLVFFIEYATIRATKFGLFIGSLIDSMITGTAVVFNLINLGNRVKKAAKPVFYNMMFSANLPMILIQTVLFIYLVTFSLPIIFYLLPVLAVSLIAMAAFFVRGRKHFNVRVATPENPFPIIKTLEFAVVFFIIFTISRLVNVFIPELLAVTIFVAAIANVASSTLSVGAIFVSGDITASFAAFLLGLAISASILKKGFLGLLLKDAYLRNRIFIYSTIVGAAALLVTYVSYYGI